MPKRCALGCPANPGITYHQFPHPVRNPDRFKDWVHIVLGKLETESDYEYYKKKVICDVHFTDSVRNRNNRLNASAIPTLHLHGLSDHIASTKMSLLKPTLSLPSTSNQTVPCLSDIASTEVSSVPKPTWSLQSTGKQTLTDISSAGIITEHNYTTLRYHRANTKEAKETVSKQESISPLVVNQLKTTRSKVKNLQTEIARLRKRNKTLKARLANANKITKENCMEIVQMLQSKQLLRKNCNHCS